jgi:hypothetical protein
LFKNLGVVVALAILPTPTPGQVLSFSARSDLVVFSATTMDGKNRPVTDLRREEFRILEEDGRSPSPTSTAGGGCRPASSCSWTRAAR